MKERKNTRTASGKKVGRPRTLTDAERRAKAEEHRANLDEWKRLHMRDPEYRAELKRRSAERRAQLAADAELGRMTRSFLLRLGEMIIGIASPRYPEQGEARGATASHPENRGATPSHPENTRRATLTHPERAKEVA